jgi:hypothetical protein
MMVTAETYRRHYTAQILVHLFSAACITAWLFYRDEGFNSFAWMRDPGAWVVFVPYVLVFTIVQFTLRRLLSGFLSSWPLTVTACASGLLITLTCLFIWFSQ